MKLAIVMLSVWRRWEGQLLWFSAKVSTFFGGWWPYFDVAGYCVIIMVVLSKRERGQFYSHHHRQGVNG